MLNIEKVPFGTKISKNFFRKMALPETHSMCSASMHTQKAMEAGIQMKAVGQKSCSSTASLASLATTTFLWG